jgi:succinyl-CoA synthetase beta subunit
LDQEDPLERAAEEQGLKYIRLDGNIGCVVNGAGLGIATLDTIALNGGSPANFFDIGWAANAG